MKKIITLFLVVFSYSYSFAQITPPYSNNFDNITDTVGWSHYALSGSDNWEFGTPSGTNLNTALSQPNVWSTNLDGDFTQNSEMCLESPFFDFSDTNKSFIFGFAHKIEAASYHGGNIQYSLDSGQTWVILNGPSDQNNQWYNNPSCSGMNNEPAWSNNWYNSYKFSYHSLDTVKGFPAVKFRFKFGGSSNPKEGWMIDNFSITEFGPNIVGIPTDTISVTKVCPTYDVNLTMVYAGIIKPAFFNKVKYYWSDDAVFDLGDSLIGMKSQNMSNTLPWDETFNLPKNLPVGLKYIFYTVDTDSLLVESNETDNLGMAVMKVDSIYDLPLISHFDDGMDEWNNVDNKWELGKGDLHHLEGSHSGPQSILNFSNSYGSIESNHLNPSIDDSTTISFWYRSKNLLSYKWYMPIQYSLGCGSPFLDMSSIPIMRDNTWDFFNLYFPIEADTANDIKIRISNPKGLELIIDDIYIGKPKADLSIERNKERYTHSSSSSDTLKYYLNNSGFVAAGASITAFYWSTDTILDGADVLLGKKNEPAMTDTAREWRTFQYTKPTTVNGVYYIIYVLDDGNVIDEMREYNNEGVFKIHQQNLTPIPYFNDFETQIDGWRHNSSLGIDDWQWTTPKGTLLDSAFSGTKVWVTNDTGLVSPMSRMHLYTPIYDLSTSTKPILEFDMKLHSEPTCHCFEGKMNMSYSLDGGATWLVVDTSNQSYNRWYYPMEYSVGNGLDWNYYIPNYTELLFDLSENAFSAFNQYNSRDVQRNTRYILDLSFFVGKPQVQFRFNLATLTNNFQSPNYTVEGALIDNFSIRESFVDLNVDYKKALMISSNVQKVKFFMHIKNQGNYISLPSTTKYYVSTDTILDGSDYYLGQDSIPKIRPDMYFYVNEAFNAPGNLSDYQYLIYELDESNTNSESNEINNIGYWPLAMDSINNYPYFNDFNDNIVDGWHQYSIDSRYYKMDNFRFRNMVAPGEPLYQTAIESGQWFTERLQSGSWIRPPYFYLETPVFNFSSLDSIFMSFDLMCTGRFSNNDKDGGNLHFSTDGGNTWTLLTASYGQAYNWYKYPHVNLNDLDNEPGWSGSPAGYGVAVLDSTAFDASFLKGEEKVVFRFKYKSNHEYYGGGTVQGMRIDNFKIAAFSLDYIVNDSITPINATLSQPDFSINYSIENIGQTNGRITTTKFYWSNDSIFDINDSLIHTITENPIPSGTIHNSSATITYPTSITQTIYYLFCVADGDSNLVETNESNNITSFKITFPSYPNYVANNHEDTINALRSQPAFNAVYSIINNGLLDGINSTTSFYWSADSLFNVGDANVLTVNEAPILLGDTLTSMKNINYPTPITQSVYYLFYKSDDNDVILETNENDNIGSFKIIFDSLTSSIRNLSDYDVLIYPNPNNGIIVIEKPIDLNKELKAKLYDATSKLILEKDIPIGIQKVEIDVRNYSKGVYYLKLIVDNEIFIKQLLKQ